MEEAVSIEIETENTESQKDANTTNENKNQYERLVSDLKIMIEMRMPEHSFPFKCRIKKIPYHLRKVNEQAYTPTIISIGPFHYYNKNLRTMEKFKVRYFKSFVQRANINSENLVSTIREMEVRISYCYAEASLSMDRDVFWKIIQSSFLSLS